MKKKNHLLLLLLACLFFACSKDDSSQDQNVLAGTAWYYEVTDNMTNSFSFSVGDECHSMSQIEGKEPIIFYYKYKVNGDNKVEVYKDKSDILYIGEFNENILTMTHQGSGESQVYKRNKHGL